MKNVIGRGLKGVLTLVLLTFLSTPVIWAQPAGPGRAKVLLPGAGQVNRLLNQIRSLDLTPEQTRALRQLVRRARPRGQEIQQTVLEARKALTQAVNRGADRQALRPAAQALTQAFVTQAVFQARIRRALLNQLTDEQRVELRLLHQERSQQRKELQNDTGR